MTERTIKDILFTPEQQEAVHARLRQLYADRERARQRALDAQQEVGRLDAQIEDERELAARHGLVRPLMTNDAAETTSTPPPEKQRLAEIVRIVQILRGHNDRCVANVVAQVEQLAGV